jgi:hypothetical protein
MVGGKRMWKWAEIERILEGDDPTESIHQLAMRVYENTKTAANR